MKTRYILFLPVLFFYLQGNGQLLKIDTVLDKIIYESYFNFKVREPLYVTYNLFKGGGDCDRDEEGFRFFVDEFDTTAHDEDYAGSGYDKGHLANAEDFADDCTEEEITFRYYNCVPQTVRMNRGIWKRWENNIRKLSQTKELFIVAGAIFRKKKLGENRIGVPTHCYKIVIDASSKKILHCLVFPNNKTNTFQIVSLTELKQRLGYRLAPAALWKKITRAN